ncbi:hypothetical protein GT755_12465 [Herbidospora sp. NEAU-GS84]|uniref:Uncharacterized protein n=1 Tax=Herbidospora solisilvae TaxID=2696284 RepID=A0A7C9NMX3_9ACTN|nr:hypothetical protein [Herbidospora solisilvae]NAS22496.1 hypothetical protein [Herbidospora solisilvae]
MTTGLLPTPIQEAIDAGRSLPRVTVKHSSPDWLDELGFAEVHFLVEGPDHIEVGTTWYPDSDSSTWRCQLAGWRTIANSKKVHPLADWREVHTFLTEQAHAEPLIDDVEVMADRK